MTEQQSCKMPNCMMTIIIIILGTLLDL